MGKPQVTLTLAGDSSKLEQTFSSVGASSKKVADEVGSASKRLGDETASGFDKAGEAADNVDTKAMGFRDTLTGVHDTMSGVGMIAKGDLYNGLFTLGAGVGDLGSGFYNLLIPAMSGFSKASIVATANTVKNTAATVASRVAQVAISAATKAWAAAQWLINAALTANPIGLVIVAVALLTAGIIYAYKHSETFRNIVNGAFNSVKTVVGGVANFITGTVWPGIKKAWDGIGSGASAAKKGVTDAFTSVVNFIRPIPGTIAGFFKGIGSAIASPFRGAFDAIRGAWNSTLGGKGFSFPGIAGKGAFSFHIPTFHTGGIVGGGLGSESLAVLKAGELVTSGSNAAAAPTTIVIRSDGTRAGEALVRLLREVIQIRGGNVQGVLGS